MKTPRNKIKSRISNRESRIKREALKFPPGFLWGASTAAYQVEGGIENNDWAKSKLPPPGPACDHYSRFEEDFALAKKLHHNSHRLSLEWSRFEPEEGAWNEEAVDHYLHVLDSLKDKGFAVFVTLHHFTNPVWVSKQGGWKNPKTILDFLKFSDRVIQSLGHLVDFWITINEPGLYAFMCHQAGFWPPFEQSALSAFRVYRNMLKGHNAVYDLIHAYYPKAQVGFAQNIAYFEPSDPGNFFDKLAVRYNEWINIDYPYKRTKNDFLGLNHYFYKRLDAGFFLWKREVIRERENELSDKGWEIYPRAIFEVLLRLKKYRKPVFITEHGIADRSDLKRAGFIVGYLKEVHRAIARGVDVRGYLHWTLLDNYEWPVLQKEKTGYEMKFGLIAVDFEDDLKRKIKKSARVYAKICKDNGVTL